MFRTAATTLQTLRRTVVTTFAATVLAAGFGAAQAAPLSSARFSDAAVWTAADIQHLKGIQAAPARVRAAGKPLMVEEADIDRALRALESKGQFPMDVAERFVATMNRHNADWGHCSAEWNSRIARSLMRVTGLDGGVGFRHLQDAGLQSVIPLLKRTAVLALTSPGSIKGSYSLDVFCGQTQVGMNRELGKIQPESGRIIINTRHPYLNNPAHADRELYVFMHEFLHWAGFQEEAFPTAVATLMEMGARGVTVGLSSDFLRTGPHAGGAHMVALSDFGRSSLSLLLVGSAYAVIGDHGHAEAVLTEAARRFGASETLRPLMDASLVAQLDPRWMLLNVQRQSRNPAAETLAASLRSAYATSTNNLVGTMLAMVEGFGRNG